MSLNLKVGAFVVTDAHYSHIRPQFLDFLKDIDSKKLNPTQLILLGDIFDALFGGVERTYLQNKDAVDILNNI
ncbi:MAG: UDP-2,3-diacylglucosamine hydrolase, partial [Campylobacterales bacterium]|nr:UDP-2,3-diacylglucosamine hydrolase [Campylobacterales bacterium]